MIAKTTGSNLEKLNGTKLFQSNREGLLPIAGHMIAVAELPRDQLAQALSLLMVGAHGEKVRAAAAEALATVKSIGVKDSFEP